MATLRLAAVAIGLLCAAGCGDNDTTLKNGVRDQALHMSIGAEPASLDPHLATDTVSHKILSALMDNLLSLDPETLKPVPALAESWSVSDDGLVYTFNIRQDAKWSNGDPLTAADFVYSWQRIFSPALGNQYVHDYFHILNSEAFYSGKINDFSQVGVKATGERSLQFTLAHPSTLFALQVADSYTSPVHRKTIESFGAIDERNSTWSRPGNYVSNGPFVLTRWETNKIIAVEKNPQYWDHDAIRLNKIFFYPVEDNAAEERMFRAGQLHLVFSKVIPAEKIQTYQEQAPEKIRLVPTYATYFYLLNNRHPHLQDVRIRRALAYSIDRESIVRNITKAGERPAYALSPMDPNGYSPQAAMVYDVEQARRLLAEAGHPEGEGFPKLTLIYNTQEKHQKIATAIQQMWKQALDIDVELENQEWRVFLDNRKHFNYAIARAGSVGTFLDPIDFLNSFVTDAGMNDAGFSNKTYDELIRQASITIDNKLRHELFQQAEAIMVQEVPLIPIFYYTDVFLISPQLKGWSFNMIGRTFYKGVYLADEDAK